MAQSAHRIDQRAFPAAALLFLVGSENHGLAGARGPRGNRHRRADITGGIAITIPVRSKPMFRRAAFVSGAAVNREFFEIIRLDRADGSGIGQIAATISNLRSRARQ